SVDADENSPERRRERRGETLRCRLRNDHDRAAADGLEGGPHAAAPRAAQRLSGREPIASRAAASFSATNASPVGTSETTTAFFAADSPIAFATEATSDVPRSSARRRWISRVTASPYGNTRRSLTTCARTRRQSRRRAMDAA